MKTVQITGWCVSLTLKKKKHNGVFNILSLLSSTERKRKQGGIYIVLVYSVKNTLEHK